jgi:hypothetical protein
VVETATGMVVLAPKGVALPTDAAITGVKAYAFAGRFTGSSLVIPDHYTTVDTMAFAACTSITSISIPATLTSDASIKNIFDGCTDIATITVTAGNGGTALWRAEGNCLVEIATNTLVMAGKNVSVIPASVTAIGDRAFSGNTTLTSITIPATVTSIGYGAFNGCTSLGSVIFEEAEAGSNDEGLTLGADLFFDCTSLETLILPARLKHVTASFRNMPALKTIRFCGAFTYDNANPTRTRFFYHCDELVTIEVTAASKTIIEELLSSHEPNSYPAKNPQVVLVDANA